MMIYRVAKVERSANISYNDRKLRKAVEEAMYDNDGECPVKIGEFETAEQAEQFARGFSLEPFSRRSRVCWEVACVSAVEVDEDGEEDEVDYYELCASVDEIISFAERELEGDESDDE